jgi:DNA-binding winged helix-turn-helix (wHTH) protein/tetratricopeptide (TPR) repeat protein
MSAASARQTIPLRYRFADVVIEPEGRRIFVGARERAASRRAFDLLLALCEAPGRVLSRDELSDRLWPGGQIVSDEALTQAIFRARAVLGAQGERIVTLRGVGIRFDAEVQREATAAAPVMPEPLEARAPAASDLAAAPTADSSSAPDADPRGSEPAAPSPVVTVAPAPVEAPVVVPPAAVTPSIAVAPVAAAISAATTADADTSPAALPSAVAIPAPAAVSPPVPAARRRSIAPFAALAAIVLIAAGFAFWRWSVSGSQWVDEGYGIRAADVHAAQGDSVRLLSEAIRHDNRGDRARARALLETLNDSDAQTPWPPLLLAVWSVGAGNSADAERWLARAGERARPLRDPYVNAVLRYVQAERDGSAADIIRYAGAVLDLRSEAWRMHLARAHLKHYQGLREAALEEIRQIGTFELGNRKLESALADRASFGDVAGAQAVLDGLARNGDAAAWDYLAGRISWSRGDVAAARAAWERAAGEAQRNGRSDIGNRAQANAGLAATLAGDRAGAIAHFERARVGMTEAGWITDEIDLSLLLAQLQMAEGRAALARREFDRAVAVAGRGGDATLEGLIGLIGARLFPEQAPIKAAGLPAVQSLAEARAAYNRGDRAAAQTELAVARQRGVLDLPFADEARLLAAELGEPVAAEKAMDPPYPPLAVAGARLALAALQSRPVPPPDAGMPAPPH